MIDPQSRSLEWIEQASGLIPNIADTALVEKAIRALSLLESLVRSGCPFVFKGLCISLPIPEDADSYASLVKQMEIYEFNFVSIIQEIINSLVSGQVAAAAR